MSVLRNAFHEGPTQEALSSFAAQIHRMNRFMESTTEKLSVLTRWTEPFSPSKRAQPAYHHHRHTSYCHHLRVCRVQPHWALSPPLLLAHGHRLLILQVSLQSNQLKVLHKHRIHLPDFRSQWLPHRSWVLSQFHWQHPIETPTMSSHCHQLFLVNRSYTPHMT